jgi:hypothetical protein
VMRLCLFTLVCGLSLLAGPTRDVEGHVVDAQTGAPIVHARVTVTFFPKSGEPAEIQLLTDDSGAFVIKNPPESNYQVTGQRSGYLSGTPAQGVAASSSSDTKTAPLIVRLTPQSAIEVSVEDENGAPVRFASVLLFHQAIVEGRRQPQVSSDFQTDDTGTVRFFGLSAGRYLIGVSVPAGASQRAKMVYPPVYYPNALDIRNADFIGLQPGQELHLRLRLPLPLPSREIRGQVAAPSGSVELQLKRADAPPFLPSLSVTTYMDPKTNNFKISGVTAGTYVLEVQAQAADQQLHASLPLTVGERDLGGIRLEARAPPPVSGTVRMEGSDNPAPPIAINSWRGQSVTRPGADGTFTFNGVLDGTYRLTSLDGSGFVRSAWQGGRDVLRDGMIVSADSPPRPLEIVLGTSGASIEGAVTLADSAQPANLVVALLRHSGSEMVLVKDYLVSGSLPDGAYVQISSQPPMHGGHRFTIRGVGPGDYLLYCWHADSPAAYAEPDFLEQYGAFGKAITVSGPDKISVTLDRVLPRTSSPEDAAPGPP